jgi:cysteine synthase A
MSNPTAVLEAIGNTPLIQLTRVVPRGAARVLVKLETANQTTSMKDRVARAMILAALADGRLSPGGTVVEYTGGSTGASLAFVCAVLGLRCSLVSSDAFSEEKLAAMRAFGAELTIVPSDNKKLNSALINAMIAQAAQLSQRPGHWFCNQLHNTDGRAGYVRMGEEAWEQSGGQVDAFVQCVGTAHSIHGTADGLRKHNRNVEVIAAEPAESAVLATGQSGSHRIEGIGIGYAPPTFCRDEVTAFDSATTAESNAMARRLAREEGVFAGTSTGLNVVVARRVAERLGAGHTVVTIAVDSGMRYLSTELYRHGNAP